MLERCARAIYVKRCERCGYKPFPHQNLSPAAQHMLADEARAAIDALMEPTPEMIEAGDACHIYRDHVATPVEYAESETVFRAMIAAAGADNE